MPWQLPENPNPPDTICIQARVPNDPAYIDAFWGAILDLGAGFNWSDDSAHTAILASRRMRQMYYEMVENNCVPTPTQILSPCSSCCEGCMAVRWNGCTLEEYDCLTQSWITVPTVNGPCNPNTAPGGGTTPPGAGKCNDYQFQFQANALTPMPFVVNTGDTLNINSLKGAGTDGTVNWFCVDGEAFVLGGCAGGQHNVGTDPLPTSPHMCVVLRIGSTYYPFFSGLFTVPSSIVNQQVWVGINDSSLSDDAGTYSIDLTYCNNTTPPAGTWCQSLDLTVSPNGFASLTINDGCGTPINNEVWVSGQGWTIPAYTPSCVGHTQSQGVISLDLGAAYTITSVELKGHYYNAGGASNAIYVNLATVAPPPVGGTSVISQTNFLGPADYDLSSGAISMSARYVIIDQYDISGGLAPGANAFVNKTLILKGTGPNPFGTSNC